MGSYPTGKSLKIGVGIQCKGHQASHKLLAFGRMQQARGLLESNQCKQFQTIDEKLPLIFSRLVCVVVIAPLQVSIESHLEFGSHQASLKHFLNMWDKRGTSAPLALLRANHTQLTASSACHAQFGQHPRRITLNFQQCKDKRTPKFCKCLVNVMQVQVYLISVLLSMFAFTSAMLLLCLCLLFWG